ncbi:MAG: metallophosphoesterase [Candidatus Zixiibacteriota bacterium]
MIKIALTSDLHVDYSAENRALVLRLVEAVQEVAPDVLVIAGDVSSRLEDFSWTLSQFAELQCKKLVVAGNHDIWIETKSDILNGKDSGARYEHLLGEVSGQNDFTLLQKEPIAIGDVGFAGCMGWFDYSFRNTSFDKSTTIDQYRAGKWQHPSKGKNFLWNDMQNVWWLRDLSAKISGFSRNDLCLSDEEIAAKMSQALDSQLKRLEETGIRGVVVVTHFVPVRELLEYRDTIPHDYFNAYHGSALIEAVIHKYASISHVLYGHSHVAKDVILDGVRYLSRPVGYLGPARLVDDAPGKLAIFEV